MAIYRAVVTLPFFSLDTKDVATNTFHFSSVADLDNTALAAATVRIEAFYAAIDGFLSPVIVSNGCTIKWFNLADPEPRIPVLTLPLYTFSLGTTGIAEENAVCLSYLATPASGAPAGRRRGRIWIGPLNSTAIAPANSSTFTRVSSTMITALAAAGAALADQSEPAAWSIFSTTDQVARKIVTGYVDNAMDTMRSRGRVATARTIWTGQA